MSADQAGGRQHSAADLLTLLAAVVLILATWACLSGSDGIVIWKSYASVTITLLLVLAGLTRNPVWAAAIRVATGLWLMAAPYLLRFHDIPMALWTYVGIGAAVTALAIPGFTARNAGRTPITA